MRKVLPLIIGFALFLSLPSTVLSYESFKDITIQHGVARIDEFVVLAQSVRKFENTRGVEVATVELRNNTRDGYKLTLKTKHGALHSATSTDGEVDIEYRFSHEISGNWIIPGDNPGDNNVATGNVGAGSFQTLSIPQIPPTTETLILGSTDALSGDSLLDEATDLQFTLKVALVTSDFVNMAGTYSDTITIEYTDL